MDHRRLGHLLDQRLGEWLQLRKDSLVSRYQRARTQGLPKEILSQLRQQIIGQQLLLVQIHHQALKAGSILHRPIDPHRKLRPHQGSTMRTTFYFGPVFRHLQRPRRQIEDLATLVVQHRFPAQTASLALGTNFQVVNLNVIGVFDPLQCLSRMTGLAAGFAPAGGAQTLGAGFAQTVAGRRLAAVLAVLGQSGFQFLDSLLQLRQSFLQRQDNLDQRLGLAAGQQQKFFTREHGTVDCGSWIAGEGPKYPSPAPTSCVGGLAGCGPGSDPGKSNWPPDSNCPGSVPVPQTFPPTRPGGRSRSASLSPGAGPRGPKCGWPTPRRAPRAGSKTDCCLSPLPVGPGAGP